jgi:hypothetical protein
MQEKIRLTFHADPGHGWLAVPAELVHRLKLSAKISRYSYRDESGTVYLEEDCDAPELIAAAANAGIELQFTGRNYERDCFIRRLPHY